MGVEKRRSTLSVLFYIKRQTLLKNGHIMFDKAFGTYTGKGSPRVESDRKSTRLNSSHSDRSRMPSSA